jgi:hypothetical protein
MYTLYLTTLILLFSYFLEVPVAANRNQWGQSGPGKNRNKNKNKNRNYENNSNSHNRNNGGPPKSYHQNKIDNAAPVSEKVGDMRVDETSENCDTNRNQNKQKIAPKQVSKVVRSSSSNSSSETTGSHIEVHIKKEIGSSANAEGAMSKASSVSAAPATVAPALVHIKREREDTHTSDKAAPATQAPPSQTLDASKRPSAPIPFTNPEDSKKKQKIALPTATATLAAPPVVQAVSLSSAPPMPLV